MNLTKKTKSVSKSGSFILQLPTLKKDGRLPAAYFAPSQFGKDAILKAENVFSSKKKNTFSSSYFSNVQSFLVLFCQINLIMRAENKFLRNITILYAFYSKFTNFSDFLKNQDFLSKNQYIFFLKKKQALNVLRNFIISVAFYGKFATI